MAIGRLNIGPLLIQPNLILAPMAGVTTAHFRSVIQAFGGCGLTWSELISSEGLSRRQPRTRSMLANLSTGRPFGVQIYGRRPEAMAEAAILAVEAGASLVDINAGCPARKVVRSMGGAYLLKDLPLLEKIMLAVRRAVQVPVTLKFRSGFDEDSVNYLETGKLALDCGLDAVTLHPRTRHMMFGGTADWEQIRRLKEILPIPVIGNGDVYTPEDAARLFASTGCDAVMIGRGIMKNPWLIRQCFDYLSAGRYRPAAIPEQVRLCLSFVDGLLTDKTYHRPLGEMKKYCSWLIHGFPGAAQQRQILYSIQDPRLLREHLAEVAAAIEDHP